MRPPPHTGGTCVSAPASMPGVIEVVIYGLSLYVIDRGRLVLWGVIGNFIAFNIRDKLQIKITKSDEFKTCHEVYPLCFVSMLARLILMFHLTYSFWESRKD